MKIDFKYTNAKKDKVLVYTPENQTIAHFIATSDGFQFTPKNGIELSEDGADIICEKFSAWLERQKDKQPEPEPLKDDAPTIEKMETVVSAIAPEPDPVSGTTSAQWLAYATEHLPNDKFTELYGDRWRKRKFREYAASVYPAFITRANRILEP